ncbi:hypothetical protein BJ912DRAFT_585368 [Pholiota molesta]|nr:hypothetical protein BJ912DRAFT_585368 [Pholiota molesta]
MFSKCIARFCRNVLVKRKRNGALHRLRCRGITPTIRDKSCEKWCTLQHLLLPTELDTTCRQRSNSDLKGQYTNTTASFPEKHALQAIRAPAQELPLLCLANGGITLLEASKRASSVLRNLQLLTRSYFMRRLSSGIQVSNQWKCPPEMQSGMLFARLLDFVHTVSDRTYSNTQGGTSCTDCPVDMNALLLALIIRKLFLLGVI